MTYFDEIYNQFGSEVAEQICFSDDETIRLTEQYAEMSQKVRISRMRENFKRMDEEEKILWAITNPDELKELQVAGL